MRKQTIFIINTHFMMRNIFELQTSATVVSQENLTSEREIKQHI